MPEIVLQGVNKTKKITCSTIFNLPELIPDYTNEDVSSMKRAAEYQDTWSSRFSSYNIQEISSM